MREGIHARWCRMKRGWMRGADAYCIKEFGVGVLFEVMVYMEFPGKQILRCNLA